MFENLKAQSLYLAAKALYRSNLGHDSSMKAANSNREKYTEFRNSEVTKVLRVCEEYEIPIRGKTVLDFGCFDGSITAAYIKNGASKAIGVDIDSKAIDRARSSYNSSQISFHLSGLKSIPLPDESVDTIVSYDVFEHVAHVPDMLRECYRVLRPGGKMLIGSWGWYNPYAPHLWSTMPVPYAHIIAGERAMLMACRKVYTSAWYEPNMHDFDESGNLKDKYLEKEINTDYLNKKLIRDFESDFLDSPFDFVINLKRFQTKFAFWTTPFLRIPYLREFFTAYFWARLTKKR